MQQSYHDYHFKQSNATDFVEVHSLQAWEHKAARPLCGSDPTGPELVATECPSWRAAVLRDYQDPHRPGGDSSRPISHARRPFAAATEGVDDAAHMPWGRAALTPSCRNSDGADAHAGRTDRWLGSSPAADSWNSADAEAAARRRPAPVGEGEGGALPEDTWSVPMHWDGDDGAPAASDRGFPFQPAPPQPPGLLWTTGPVTPVRPVEESPRAADPFHDDWHAW